MLLLLRTFPLLPSAKEESEMGEFLWAKRRTNNGIKKAQEKSIRLRYLYRKKSRGSSSEVEP